MKYVRLCFCTVGLSASESYLEETKCINHFEIPEGGVGSYLLSSSDAFHNEMLIVQRDRKPSRKIELSTNQPNFASESPAERLFVAFKYQDIAMKCVKVKNGGEGFS